eukprot:CAMPEP_0179989594 /NCGR_PEP_ID=MMETSP0984-20121128/3982_1 /TAXON_ID=483367 /ORGANISM="non described non described, Strain CCMP 2436" /LENGTH=301 /DNA_ID=CAMNT_0021908723 /DNA_START=250 /DNA_END=1160 /DNA_ORIENTATION=-
MSFVHRDSPYQDKRRARTSASAFRGTAPLKRAAQASDKAAVAEASVAEAAVWRIAPMSGAHRALEGAAHAPASKHAPAPLPLRAVLLPLRPAHAAPPAAGESSCGTYRGAPCAPRRIHPGGSRSTRRRATLPQLQYSSLLHHGGPRPLLPSGLRLEPRRDHGPHVLSDHDPHVRSWPQRLVRARVDPASGHVGTISDGFSPVACHWQLALAHISARFPYSVSSDMTALSVGHATPRHAAAKPTTLKPPRGEATQAAPAAPAAAPQAGDPHAAHVEGLPVLRVEFTQVAPVAPATARPVGEV